MKKFTLTLAVAALGMSAMAASLSPTVLYKTPTGVDGDNVNLYTAYDNSDKGGMSWAIHEIKGEDEVITIFDDEFQAAKTFTLKGVNKSQEINGEQVSNSYVTELDVYGVDLTEIVATRNVFTNDEKWCVTVRTWWREGDEYKAKLEVYNEDGENLGELPLSESSDPGYFRFSRVRPEDGEFYYCTTDEDYNRIIWTFTGNSGISAPAANNASALKAYPNPLPAGARLNIELDRPADENTVLSVIDTNGRQIMRKRLVPGTSTTTVDGRRLHGGMLIYTVAYGDGEVASGKLCTE